MQIYILEKFTIFSYGKSFIIINHLSVHPNIITTLAFTLYADERLWLLEKLTFYIKLTKKKTLAHTWFILNKFKNYYYCTADQIILLNSK